MESTDQQAGDVKGSLVFDGNNEYLGTSYTQTSVTAYIIEAWVKTSTNNLQRVIVHDRGSGRGKSLTLSIGGTYPSSGQGLAGELAFGVDSNNIYIGRNSTAKVNDNAWHYVVGCWTAPSGTSINPASLNLY